MITSIDRSAAPVEPLSPWTYQNQELFELEYETMFLRRWQFVGHVNDLPEAGSYVSAEIGRDSVVVVRDKSGALRAFLNVCRHRASRIFEGTGTCRGVIRCPYHGWTYKLDGSLMAIPQQENFPHTDKTEFGLHEIQLDTFHGLLFVRVKGDGPDVAEHFAHTGGHFEQYGVGDYVQFAEPTTQVWNANWKVAWDNYLENYHIPIGHPGLHRLLRELDEWDELSSGVGYGIFAMNEKLSSVEEERLYQQNLHYADARIPDEVKGKWVQYGFAPNLGVDLYPEMLDMFQLVPLAVDKTLVRTFYYGHQNPTPEERELRRLNILINDSVNNEDKTLCERVQKGLSTHSYRPGPLSQLELTISNFHNILRDKMPVMSLRDAPTVGSVATENSRLLND